MPILTPEEIANLQTNVREAIMEAKPDQALELLEDALPAGRAKHSQVILLKSRQSGIVLHTISNTLSEERLELLRNNLTADILLFIEHLTTADFQPKPAQRPGLKPGHLLYQVPTVMEVQTTYDCLVRVAEELNQVLEGLAGEEDIVVEEIGITEVMEVEILDPGGADNPVFDIMLLSDGEQVVDEYSYTEWVFNVRPLKEGQHELILKISVLLTVKGKERTKNVILRRPISILAKATGEVPAANFRRIVAPMDESVSVPPPAAVNGPEPIDLPGKPSKTFAEAGGDLFQPKPSIAPTRDTGTNRKSKRRSYLSLAATLLILILGGFWLIQSNSWGDINQVAPPKVGTKPDNPTLTLPDVEDSLLTPKSLLTDTLEID